MDIFRAKNTLGHIFYNWALTKSFNVVSLNKDNGGNMGNHEKAFSDWRYNGRWQNHRLQSTET